MKKMRYAVMLVVVGMFDAGAQVPQIINYQGRLLQGTNLVNGNVALQLQFYNASLAGTLLYEDSNTVSVVDGLYSTFIGDNTTFGSLDVALTNSEVWIEAVVNGATLSPRERFASVGYSRMVRGLLVTTNASVILNTESSGNMIHESVLNGVIGGGVNNTIAGGAEASVVDGGQNNRISTGAFFSVVGGGAGNVLGTNAVASVIGGGSFNVISNLYYGTVCGGSDNVIGEGSQGSAIAGGQDNFIQSNAKWSIIGGGLDNNIGISSDYALIVGGYSNVIGTNASYAVIPGGDMCAVGDNADYAFAAGKRAKVNHKGAFVWADSTDADFVSTSSNQFLIRATEYVGVNIDSPDSVLHVKNFLDNGGSIRIGGNIANTGVVNKLRFGDENFCAIYESNTDDDDMVIDAENLGISRYPTANKLEVEGDASKTIAGDWAANSDARIKEDVQSLSNALDVINRLRPVGFHYTDAYRAQHPSIRDVEYYNYIAQEFRDVFPDSVKDSGEDGLLQVDAYPAGIYAIAAIQELHALLKERDARIEKLEARLDSLEQNK